MVGISRLTIHLSAKRLDKIYPGWHNLIDTDRLNMVSTDDCILGQVGRHTGGDFSTTIDKFYGWRRAETSPTPLPKFLEYFIVAVAFMPFLWFALTVFIPNFCMGKRHWIRQIGTRRQRDEAKKIIVELAKPTVVVGHNAPSEAVAL